MNLFGHLVGSLDGGSARRRVSTYTGQHNTEKRAHIHTPSGIRSRDPSARAVEDSTCLRPRVHWYRLRIIVCSLYFIMRTTCLKSH